mgnify:CR=1 FL=1
MIEVKVKEVRLYTDPTTGDSPIEEYIDSLSSNEAAVVEVLLDKLEKGKAQRDPIIGVENMSEIKTDKGAGWRIYFTEFKNYYMVWGVGTKKTQKRKDIPAAIKLYKASGHD